MSCFAESFWGSKRSLWKAASSSRKERKRVLLVKRALCARAFFLQRVQVPRWSRTGLNMAEQFPKSRPKIDGPWISLIWNIWISHRCHLHIMSMWVWTSLPDWLICLGGFIADIWWPYFIDMNPCSATNDFPGISSVYHPNLPSKTQSGKRATCNMSNIGDLVKAGKCSKASTKVHKCARVQVCTSTSIRYSHCRPVSRRSATPGG